MSHTNLWQVTLQCSFCHCDAFPKSECHSAKGSQSRLEQTLQGARAGLLVILVEACIQLLQTPTAFPMAQLQSQRNLPISGDYVLVFWQSRPI